METRATGRGGSDPLLRQEGAARRARGSARASERWLRIMFVFLGRFERRV
jgi:hypothetical protein